MKYRSVGKSGLKISEVALGSWVTDLKGTAAEDVAKETVKLAYDSGVNFFDCADAYSGGAAERFLGKTLKQYPRKELVISSKVYFPTGEGVNDRGLSRKHIFESIDQTLKNMQTDYLDMYFCHRFDETTDLTETLRAMSDLVAQGKVLYYGVSEEWGSARLEEAQRIIDRYNLYPITVVQPQYNLNDRYIEHEIMGTCRKLGIGITTFSPLAQGLLTGKVTMDTTYPEGSTRNSNPNFQPARRAQALAMLNNWQDLTEKYHCTMAQLVIALTARMVPGLFVLCGARTPEQVTDNAGAMQIQLDGADAVRMKWDVDSIS